MTARRNYNISVIFGNHSFIFGLNNCSTDSSFFGIVKPELFKRIEERYYSVEEKSQDIMKYLERKRNCTFVDLFIGVRSRSEAVAVFMALLELVRDGLIDVEGNGEDIELSFVENGGEEAVDGIIS